MGMELRVTMELSDGDRYPNETSVTRRFEVNLPWAPGNHNAETALVEAIGSIINFGEVIGELHEELTAACEDKLHEEERRRAMREDGGAADMQAATEQSGIETAERQQVPEQAALVEAQAEQTGNADDTEVPQ